MKKTLLVTLLLLAQCIYAQLDANTCENAYSLCGALGAPFLNNINAAAADQSSATSYGCLASQPNAVWFYLSVNNGGDLNFTIEQSMDVDFNQDFIDVDFICWGPFSTTNGVCGPQYLNPANESGCSYSTSATEVMHIPDAPSDSYYIVMVTNFSNLPGYIRITNFDSGVNDAAINCSGLNLNAFLDSNANGIQDDGEINFPYGDFVYTVNNDTIAHNITSFDGIYMIYDLNTDNSYNISYELPAGYAGYYSSLTTYTNINPQPASLLEVHNFPVTVLQPFSDVSVNVIPGQPPVPGFTYETYVTYTNTGTVAIPSGTITYTNNSGFTIQTVSESGAITTTSGFEFTFTDLQPFETRTITVVTLVPVIPDVALGDEVTDVATAVIENDVVADNNSYSSTQVIIGSYDPNDITESRGPEIELANFTESDYLYYTIRFQNTGTAPAVSARIENLMGPGLDQSTLQMLHSSHDFILDRQDNHLIWRFNQIRLPAEQDNEPESHGYVYFRVKPTPGYALGDIIPNAADIYFDFNPAIVTNTFESEFVEVLSAVDFKAANYIVYPNPAKNVVHIASSGKNASAITAVKVFDLTGKTIYESKNNPDSEVTINTSAFAAGTYFVEVQSSSNARTVKKLTIH